MAATPYDPAQKAARDRVRKLVSDKAAPLRYQDEEIAVELANAGFDGGDSAETPPQPIPELVAAITLLEDSIIVTGQSETIKMGSVSHTVTGATSGGYDTLLANLRRRLALLVGESTGDPFGVPVVVDGFPCPCEEVRCL